MPPSSSVVISSGRPTVRRRTAQASRGRPMTVSASGAPISTPSVSPTHQVPQVSRISPSPMAPPARSTAVATLGLTRQATTAPNRPLRPISPGVASTSGCGTKRRTSAAPSAACSVAPTAMAPGRTSAARSICPREADSTTFTRKAPAAVPTSAGRPCISAAASAMPVDGYSGDA